MLASSTVRPSSSSLVFSLLSVMFNTSTVSKKKFRDDTVFV